MAPTRQSLDVARRFGVVAQRVPNLLDGEVEAVLKIYNSVVAPDLVLDFFSCYQLGGTAYEQGEHSRRLRRQVEENTCLPQLTRLEIQLESPEAYSRLHRRGTGHGTPPWETGPPADESRPVGDHSQMLISRT